MGEIDQIPNHQVKVDNWPLFFLQRLNQFYRKKTHCDLTLLFSTLDTIKSIKVHRLVLHACTDYFESLDVMKDSEHGEFLQLSNEMHPDVVIPIISFMYTGKLEFPVTLQPRLYEAAIKLRMTILTKLLDVQPNKVSQKSSGQPLEEEITKVSISSSEGPIPLSNVIVNNKDTQDVCSIPDDSSLMPSNFQSALPKQVDPLIALMPVSMTVAQQNQSAKPEVAFVQCPEVVAIKSSNQSKPKIIKKNVGLQLATVNTKAKVVDVTLPPTLPGRRLPVWKRKVPLTVSQFVTDSTQNVRTNFRVSEKPKPTRFEWEEDLNDPTEVKPVEDALKILSHDGTMKIPYPIILEPDVSANQKESSDESFRRNSDRSSSESPPYKRSKQSDLQDMKEYGKQQQLRNEIICSEENADDLMDADDLYGPCDDESDDLSNLSITNSNSSTPKPILKSVTKPEPPVAFKRVRFSLEGKENNQQQENETVIDFTSSSSSTPAKPPEPVVSKQKIVLPMNVSQIQSGKHHVKIVSEVLKKYPNLAKRENIKLRVVSKNPAAVPPTVQQAVEGDAGGGNKLVSSLVSYIFLTNKSSGELLPVKTETSDKDKLFDVENKTGPWFCQVCDEVNPIEFESYYTYRRHLVEVHELKIDARICEYCGLRSSKRNHLLYHLYTKHGIDPPAHVSFPKCSECDHVALSEALLVKHKGTHEPKGLTCYTCNVVFKSFSSMQVHLQSSWHKSKLNEGSISLLYPCPFCDAHFESGNELKDHIESEHHSQEGKQIYRCPYCEALFEDGDKLGKHIVSLHWGKNNQVPNQGTKKKETFEPQSGQQLQYSEAESSSTVDSTDNQQSSELESLSNVASGIATSLSLVGNEQTVMYYEQRTEGQDIGREATVISGLGDECKDYIISSPAEEIDGTQCQVPADDLGSVNIDNEDSNSRTSNPEEVNRSTCSDHDYSEPQGEDHLRQMIPVHTVASPMSENTVIQQIIPDQRLVFSNQGNVVFQSPCVNLPPRLLLTSNKVVLPRMTTGDQSMILSQVIPQTPIILSGPILQQPGSIIEDGSGTIVFADSEVTDHMAGIQTTMHYSIQNTDSVESIESVESDAQGKPEDELVVSKNESEVNIPDDQDVSNPEKEKEKYDVNSAELVRSDDVMIEERQESCDADVNTDVNTDDKEKELKLLNRVETSKIVDDWDETNDSQQNVESRSEGGPSRPEFF